MGRSTKSPSKRRDRFRCFFDRSKRDRILGRLDGIHFSVLATRGEIVKSTRFLLIRLRAL